MLGTHVDDVLYACKPGFEYLLDPIFESYDVKKIEEGEFRFCGREIKQDAEYNITVTCRDTVEKTENIAH